MKRYIFSRVIVALSIFISSQQVFAQSNEEKTLGIPQFVEPIEGQHESNEPLVNASSAGEGFIHPQFSEFIRVTGALALVIGLILVVRAALKRFGGVSSGGARPSGVLEVMARYPIARGQQLMVLKFARRIILVHQSNTSVNAVSEVTDCDEVAGILSRLQAGSSERDSTKFRAALREYESRYRTSNWPQSQTEVVDLTRTENSHT